MLPKSFSLRISSCIMPSVVMYSQRTSVSIYVKIGGFPNGTDWFLFVIVCSREIGRGIAWFQYFWPYSYWKCRRTRYTSSHQQPIRMFRLITAFNRLMPEVTDIILIGISPQMHLTEIMVLTGSVRNPGQRTPGSRLRSISTAP